MRYQRVVAVCVAFGLLEAVPISGQLRGDAYAGAASGEREVRAVAEAYPDRVDLFERRNGEWALRMDGVWYAWAESRLLPFAFVGQRDDFVPIRFYNYNLGPLVVRPTDEDLAERLQDRTGNRANDQRLRFNGFLDALYEVGSKEEADRLMDSASFFGRESRVHPRVVMPLQRVESRLSQMAVTDARTKNFVENLAQIHGYNWRNIAGTSRRSYHAYGVAIDLVPGRYDGWAYWQWAADGGVDEWWNLPAGERMSVPQTVIDAFEAEGFVWGGKWLFFDNIHFEYRPEVIALVERPFRQ